MSAELLASKLFIPPLRQSLVPRPRLIQSLNEGLSTRRKLTLISAPAGFGKTTLVVAWLEQIDQQAAWLSLDEADNDLPSFLGYLAAAFQQIDEGIGGPLLNALQSPQLPPIEKILTAFLNEIATGKDSLLLVLDDYHVLGDAAILQVMEFLLFHLPPQLHLVITTREDPGFPLARFRALNQITEIRALDLRFTQSETDAFLRGVMGLELSGQDVAALENRTEGWAAGLQLAGLSMQRQRDVKAFIADFSGSNRYILDYLTDEVLRQQSKGIRSFLLDTSILDRLSGPLCDALTGGTESDRILAHLETANLFVIPLDEERRWYRYHHLFSDLLRNQLARLQPARVPELHRRASRWFEENGDVQASIEHALQDTDLTQAARLIEKYSLPKIYQGEVARVVGWFDSLPDAALVAAPMLCIAKAWALVLLQRGARREEVGQALQAADLALDRVDADQALRNQVAGHAASIQAFLLRKPALTDKKPEKLIALSQEALRLLPEQEKAIRGAAALNIGYGYQSLSDLEAANLAFQQVLEDGVAGGNYYAAIYGPVNLIVSALLKGRLREARQLCDTNIERFNQLVAGQYFPPIGALYILKGWILLEEDCLSEAEPALIEGIDLVRWTGDSFAPKKGSTALARLRAIQGDRAAAMAEVKNLEESWPEGALYVQALRHRLLIRHWPDDPGVMQSAHAWLAQSEIEFHKQTVIESIDPISRSTYDCCLNAAHVLARLQRTNPGGYPVENAHSYLRRQQEFAESRGFIRWLVELAIARALLFQADGNELEALETLQVGISAGVHTGLFRTFVDEGESLRVLLEKLKPRLIDDAQIGYASRLLKAFHVRAVKSENEPKPETLLSERELEVLRYLAQGMTYEGIGRQLFLSLNTVQFHVKNIYGKLLVNKRVQAIEKAREIKLI